MTEMCRCCLLRSAMGGGLFLPKAQLVLMKQCSPSSRVGVCKRVLHHVTVKVTVAAAVAGSAGKAGSTPSAPSAAWVVPGFQALRGFGTVL
jgi:hypothetical protein